MHIKNTFQIPNERQKELSFLLSGLCISIGGPSTVNPNVDLLYPPVNPHLI